MARWSTVVNRIRTVAATLTLILTLTLGVGAQDAVTAIKAGKIITISGPDITNGVILIRGTKILAVGANLPIPSGVPVMEAAVVMPGMVEAHTSRGMDAPNENVAVVPFVSTAD